MNNKSLSILVSYTNIVANQTVVYKIQNKIHIDEALGLQAMLFPNINNKIIVMSKIEQVLGN